MVVFDTRQVDRCTSLIIYLWFDKQLLEAKDLQYLLTPLEAAVTEVVRNAGSDPVLTEGET